MLKGIDVSYSQGTIDWKKVKSSGEVDFVIIRAGYGKLASQKDKFFETNYAGCKANGIPCGAYWYSYATTVAEAKEEAKALLQVIKGRQFEYPIYFDLEEKSAFNTGKANCSAMVRAFCGTLEEAGYYAGLYMSRSPFTTNMEPDIRDKYTLWLAEYSSKLNYDGNADMWQYSATGRVTGITENTSDMDYCYKDFPSVIKRVGLNGYPKSGTTETPKKDEPVVQPTPTPEPKKEIKMTVEFEDGTYKGTLEKVN